MTMSRTRLSLSLAVVIGASCLVAPAIAPVQANVGQAPFAADLPPQARPGECYGRVVTAPVYGTVLKEVLDRAAWTETVQGPPVIEKVTRRVLVRPARVQRTKAAPTYKTVVSWTTKPGVVRTVTKPARYKTVTEKVLVEPARAEWRLTSAPLAYGETRAAQTMLQATGEVYCRVLIPARYEHVERRVKIASARTYTVQGPPRKIKHVERVMVSEGGWIEKTIPAVYRTEVIRTVQRPGKVKVVTHPAVYRTVERPALVKPAGEGWALVVCGGIIHPAFMARVQEALIAAGYDAGVPDGIGHGQTYEALRQYQRDRGLAQGQLTVESARALGVL
jgi:hypothetical protein